MGQPEFPSTEQTQASFLPKNSIESGSLASLFSVCLDKILFSERSFFLFAEVILLSKPEGIAGHCHPDAKMSGAQERNKGTGLCLQGGEAWPETLAPWVFVEAGSLDICRGMAWVQQNQGTLVCFSFP